MRKQSNSKPISLFLLPGDTMRSVKDSTKVTPPRQFEGNAPSNHPLVLTIVFISTFFHHPHLYLCDLSMIADGTIFLSESIGKSSS